MFNSRDRAAFNVWIIFRAKFIAVYVVCFSAQLSFSQPQKKETRSTRKLDSLKNVTASSRDVNAKIEALYTLSDELKKSDPDGSALYSKQCLDLALSSNNHKWTTSAFNQLGRLHMAKGEMEIAGEIYKKALAYELKARPIDKEKLAKVYFNLGTYNKRKNSYKQAVSFFNKSLDLEIELNNKRNQSSCLLSISAMFQFLGQIDTALIFMGRGYEIAKAIGDTSLMESFSTNYSSIYEVKGEYAKALNHLTTSLTYVAPDGTDAAYIYANIGNIYYYQGQISKTISYYEKAIGIFERNGNENECAMTLQNLGVILADQNIFDKALFYYEKSTRVFKKLGNKDNLAAGYINMGNVYEKTGKLDKAMQNFREALAISLETGNKNNLATAYQDIGTLYSLKGSYPLAIKNIEKGLEVFLEMGDERFISEAYCALGGLHTKTGNYKLAEDLLNKALNKSQNVGSAETQEKVYANLLELYSLKNDKGISFSYHKKHLELVDSLRKTENFKAVKDLLVRYDVREKEDSLKMQTLEILRQEEMNAKKDIINRQKSVLLTISIVGLLIISVFAAIAFINYRKKQKANFILSEQKKIIEEKSKEITDSINYARRIQYALLAGDSLLKNNLPDHFVLFKPKDVVSGDFYWAAPTAEGFVYITADCTGHGVPGAFMSLLNISKLSQTINENRITRPDLILNNVRSEIIKVLNPDGSTEESKDGMDAVLCKLDLRKMKLEYAAANNSFYIIRKKQGGENEILNCKADKMPVGKYHDNVGSFTFNEISLQKEDTIYTFTDGYADQFGGPLGKKFKYKQLEELLLSINNKSLQTQSEILLQKFNDWKGEIEQVDDVLIIGVRV